MACVFAFPNGNRGILQCQEKGHAQHVMLLFVDPQGRDSTMIDMLSLERLTGEALAEAMITKDLRDSMREDS